MQVRSPGQQDPLKKDMSAHSSILVWRIPWTEAPGRLPSTGSQRVRHDWVTSLSPGRASYWLKPIRCQRARETKWYSSGAKIKVKNRSRKGKNKSRMFNRAHPDFQSAFIPILHLDIQIWNIRNKKILKHRKNIKSYYIIISRTYYCKNNISSGISSGILIVTIIEHQCPS